MSAVGVLGESNWKTSRVVIDPSNYGLATTMVSSDTTAFLYKSIVQMFVIKSAHQTKVTMY